MDIDGSLPEEFIDILVHDFAYDPIRLPISHDPSQLLYNRRTLEMIWDSKRDAINPYTRQPFHICDAIPQTELRQRMHEFILSKRSQGIVLALHVIPDYTQVLNERGMKDLLKELVVAVYQCLKKTKRRSLRNIIKADDGELEHWNALWRKLNLVRLYCQYRVENRGLFRSMKGYEYLFQLTSKQLLNSCIQRRSGEYSCDDAKEVCKEVARIVDIVGGLKEIDLRMARQNSVFAFVRNLYELAHNQSGYLKIQSMVLRICRQLVEHCMDYIVKKNFMFFVAEPTVCVYVERESTSDLVNEDVYNGMAMLKAASIDHMYSVNLEAVHKIVTICISRLQDLHDPQPISGSNSSSANHDEAHNGEVGNNNIDLISKALEQGLFVICSLVTHPSAKASLRNLGTVNQILRMGELVNAGNKLFQTTHLEFGQKSWLLSLDSTSVLL